MATLTAVFDACVLYPAPLRDLLMRLALIEPISAMVEKVLAERKPKEGGIRPGIRVAKRQVNHVQSSVAGPAQTPYTQR